jgi:hypothetical protein
MRRLYFLVPDVRTTRAVVGELVGGGIPEGRIHAVASSRIKLEGLPEATALQTSELWHGLEKGLGIGGVAGLLGGLLAVAFPPVGLVLGGQALLLSMLVGAGAGAVVSALVAKDIPNQDLQSYNDAIARGQILLMVDVPKGEVTAWMDRIQQHHPTVDFGVCELPPP